MGISEVFLHKQTVLITLKFVEIYKVSAYILTLTQRNSLYYNHTRR